jgi:mannitol-1-phosphate 5-dehydrogenase
MSEHVFTGFGFGPIQAGLFVNEAFVSGNFSRIVVAEIDETIVDAVRANNGTYFVNVAKSDGIEAVKIDGIEIYDPNNDRKELLEAISQSTEIVTSLPSVKFFDMGQNSVASLIAQGLKDSKAEVTIIYTAENNNHAAEILKNAVAEKTSAASSDRVRFLNTVIGKMSRVITNADEIKQLKLKPVTPGIERAFLVEQFNRILVTQCTIKDFTPGIEVFIEKENLLPFEEAKLYGHNAIHALLAYLGIAKGYKKMTELKDDSVIMKIARDAFLNESGAALIKKYADLDYESRPSPSPSVGRGLEGRDELFTEAGYRYYAEDLLERMTNPYLEDTTARAGRDPVRKLGSRAGRDPVRKLGYNDRIFGTMVLALKYGIEPVNMAIAAVAGLRQLLANPKENNLPDTFSSLISRPSPLVCEEIEKVLTWLWRNQPCQNCQKLAELLYQAQPKLTALLKE